VRLAGLALALALTGCSILFNPDNARPPPCPTSPDRCPSEPNATAVCQQTQCGYTCNIGFVDDDGDLGQPGSNGCETPCSSCTPAPAYLEAVVGPASGGVQLFWPDVDAGTKEAGRITTYRVYQSFSPGAPDASHLDVPRSACDAGLCSTSISSLIDNTRYYFQATSLDLYGNESDAGGAPTTSATPINGSGASVAGWTTGSSCLHGFNSNDGGSFEIDTDLLCITSASTGDDQWQDYTLDVEVNISPGAGSAITGGPVLWSNGVSSSSVLSVTALPCAAQLDQSSAFRAGFAPLSGAVECVPLQTWFALRVVTESSLASFQLGLDGGPFQEVVRFRDPSAAPGKIGLAAGSFALGGTVLFRNLRVSTRPQMPASGPTSLHLDFGNLPSTTRLLGGGTSVGACPSLPGATGCDAGECPVPNANCLFVDVSDGGEAGLALDLPVGIDPAQSYEVRFGYAPVAPAGRPDILRGPTADLLAAMDAGSIAWVGQALDAGLSVGMWNAVDVVVAPDAGSITLRWNGQPAVAAPISFDAGTFDLTPLILGTPAGGAPMHGVYTPLDVTPR
jgi:hypothetical protein